MKRSVKCVAAMTLERIGRQMGLRLELGDDLGQLVIVHLPAANKRIQVHMDTPASDPGWEKLAERILPFLVRSAISGEGL